MLTKDAKEELWKVFPELETRRLFLVRLTEKKIPELLKIWGDPIVAKYNGFPPMDEVEIKNSLRFNEEEYHDCKGIRWGIVLKSNSQLIGTVGYNRWQTVISNKAMLGADVRQEYWNRGISSEASNRIIEYGFNQMKLHRIEAETSPENFSAQKVLEKLGFTFEGTLRDAYFWKSEYRSMRLYSLLEHEFAANIND
jgi:ribosomal-protein-alanine N-acetyltransferase